jgi:hypothetical protein
LKLGRYVSWSRCLTDRTPVLHQRVIDHFFANDPRGGNGALVAARSHPPSGSMAGNAARGDRQAPGQLPAARAGRVCARGVRVSQCSSRRLSRGRYCCARDAATLYTIVTLATGQRCTERTGFKSLVICEGAAKQQRQREPLTSKTQISRASPSVGACWGCGPARLHICRRVSLLVPMPERNKASACCPRLCHRGSD